jgi:hypothetical protein
MSGMRVPTARCSPRGRVAEADGGQAAGEGVVDGRDTRAVPPTTTQGADHAVGDRLTGHLVDRWEHDDTLMALLRAAVTNPAAAGRMRELFAAQLGPVVAKVVENPAEVPVRAGLVATQALGFALTRYVLRLPPVVAMDRDEVGPGSARSCSAT